jgi:RNA polymerase sigma-70 factor (ECF subfamily)
MADQIGSAMGGHQSDETLLRLWRQGASTAATELHRRYATRLQALAESRIGTDLHARFDAEDIVQSVFRTFFRRAANGQYDVPEGEELWGLFLVIGLNKLRDKASHHRAAKRNAARTARLSALDVEREALAVSEEESLRTLRLVIDELLANLSPDQGRMVELRIAGHSFEEIAALTRRSKRSVERTLQEFRGRLREVIDGQS